MMLINFMQQVTMKGLATEHVRGKVAKVRQHLGDRLDFYRGQTFAHGRTPDMVFKLMSGLCAFVWHAFDRGVIDQEKATAMLTAGEAAIMEAARACRETGRLLREHGVSLAKADLEPVYRAEVARLFDSEL